MNSLGGKLPIFNKRKSAVVGTIATVAAVGIALAGCTTNGGSNKPQGGTVTVAVVNDMSSLNNNTPQGNLDTNGFINYMDIAGFNYIDNHYAIQFDTKFGKVEKLKDNPLTVKYTINDGQKWSDGQPVTADDMMLAWAINSGYYDANACNDPAGDVTPTYFQTAGGTAGLCATSIPTIGDNNQSITLTYSTPYVDWKLFSPVAQPAHIVAKKAGLASAAALTKLLQGLPAGTAKGVASPNAQLAAASKFVNTGYDVTSFPTDKDLLVSSGPFILASWQKGQTMTFVRNKDYAGGLVPNVSKIVLRVIPDASAQATALGNGEVDIAYPQASADTVAALKATGMKVLEGSQSAYDHLDLNFKSKVFSNPTIRQAFLKTIPRDVILKSIVTPVNPSAGVLNSQIWLPQQSQYANAVKNNGSSAYGKADIAGAKALLKGATPTVKILYNTNNPNRVDEFQAIQASAALAGFKVVDGGSPDWGSLLSGGNYDASLFGWISPGAGYAGISQIWSTAGGGNFNGFTATNTQANEVQTTLDQTKLDSLLLQIDQLAFSNNYGLPLFQLPGIWGVNSKKVDGVVYYGGQQGPLWNFWQWSVNKTTK